MPGGTLTGAATEGLRRTLAERERIIIFEAAKLGEAAGSGNARDRGSGVRTP